MRPCAQFDSNNPVVCMVVGVINSREGTLEGLLGLDRMTVCCIIKADQIQGLKRAPAAGLAEEPGCWSQEGASVGAGEEPGRWR